MGKRFEEAAVKLRTATPSGIALTIRSNSEFLESDRAGHEIG